MLVACLIKNYFGITYLLEDEHELSLGMLIRVKRIYNFEWYMLILWCCHMFLLSYHIIFMHFVGLTYRQDAQCQFPVSACFVFKKVHHRKYRRNYLEIYGDFLCEGIHLKTKGEPEGPPTGHTRPPAAGGARPGPWGTPSAPSDAYKIPKSLILTGRPLFSTEDIPTRHYLKPDRKSVV